MKKLEGNRKDWIKNILIVFLIILLLLTFFFQYDYELFACRGIKFIYN